jgi:FKBP-type peptidyl-prolyl cis-trans isomerase SlpA
MIEIGPNTSVRLNFAVKLATGDVIDSNFDAEPVQFRIGDGNLLPGFERALFGLHAGERAELRIEAEQGFGPYRDDNLQRFGRNKFVDELEIGMVVSFADAARGELPGVVVALEEDQVEVDFNHPLAGRDLIFEVAIHEVSPDRSH